MIKSKPSRYTSWLTYLIACALILLTGQAIYIVILGGTASFFYLYSYIAITLFSIYKKWYYHFIFTMAFSSIIVIYFIINQEYTLIIYSLIYCALSVFKAHYTPQSKRIISLIILFFIAAHQHHYLHKLQYEYAQYNNGETWQKYGAL